MVGIETNQDHTEGMETVIIPKSTWLVFESIGPISLTLGDVWKRIYGKFLPQSIYKQAETPTMEVYYRNDTWADDYYCEVWIPVVRN
jgi:AraC family transcriptional regulator